MAGLNETLSRKALDLITKYGKTTVLTRIANTHDSATLISANAETAYPCKCVVADPATDAFARMTLTRVGSRFIYVAARNLGTAPLPGDLITLDAAAWVVLEVHPVYVQESPVMYGLAVKT